MHNNIIRIIQDDLHRGQIEAYQICCKEHLAIALIRTPGSPTAASATLAESAAAAAARLDLHQSNHLAWIKAIVPTILIRQRRDKSYYQ